MSKRNRKGKNKNKSNDNSNNLNYSVDNQVNEISIFNNENSIILDESLNLDNNQQIDDNQNNKNNKDIFESALLLMDEKMKNGLCFTPNYEPNFSINYPNEKFKTMPIFTPSTRLNSALQIEDKDECFIFYYTQKKTLYPTIYNQLLGVSGSEKIFVNNGIIERDLILANMTSIIFTNQKNLINLRILINEYINPLMNEYKKSDEEKKIFIEELCKNIIIQEYFSYDELFMKVNELNIQFTEHKINNVGLIIIDGLNSITPHKLEILEKENGKGYKLKFFKYIMHKFDNNSNKKNKRISNENNLQGRKSSRYENVEDVKNNIYGNDSSSRKRYDNNSPNAFNDKLQQNIVDLISNYQEKYNFNLILTIFDFSQDNFYNSSFGGKLTYKDNKNVYVMNCPELQKENCYFSFKLPKIFFPRKTIFLEPFNYNLNYNNNIFGLITNPVNTRKLVFRVFKKNRDDYRPIRILDKIEYDFQ